MMGLQANPHVVQTLHPGPRGARCCWPLAAALWHLGYPDRGWGSCRNLGKDDASCSRAAPAAPQAQSECPSLPLTVEALVPTSPCTLPVSPTSPSPSPETGGVHPGATTAPVQTHILPPSPEPREGLISISWPAGSAPCPLHSWAGALGTQQQCWGAAPSPSPFMTPSPRWLLPLQWFIGVGARSPWQCGKHRGGATEGPQEPRLLRQGPISSLTKAAMQYWRATGNPKLQYLRAARALLTALHSLQTPPSLPQTQDKGPLAHPLPGKGQKSNS